MKKVRAKKHLGQHFLKDQNIARKIADAISFNDTYNKVLEIGPGMGVLTQYLIERDKDLTVVELDSESVLYLQENFPAEKLTIIEGDFLKIKWPEEMKEPFALIGNFPYNISSQIIFKVLEHREFIPEMAGMFQREVARRLSSPPGIKDYGILTVLLNAYYKVDYLFTVNEGVFQPPPKVKSGVIRLTRLDAEPDVEYSILAEVVKSGFGQRRKKLSNALKPFNLAETPVAHYLEKRAEQLTVDNFIEIAKYVASTRE